MIVLLNRVRTQYDVCHINAKSGARNAASRDSARRIPPGYWDSRKNCQGLLGVSEI